MSPDVSGSSANEPELLRVLPEVEVQQQQLQKGWRESKFCGAERGGGEDCISVSRQNIQDLRSNGRILLGAPPPQINPPLRNLLKGAALRLNL